MSTHDCSWCGTVVGDAEGLRALSPEQDRGAVFCRLEHVVPWGLQGGVFPLAEVLEGDGDDGDGLGRCAQCAEPVGSARVLLVRHRGPLRVADVFCGLHHLVDWAKAGGRLGSGAGGSL